MGKPNFSDEFKPDAVAPITEHGSPVADVAKRLGVIQHSLYAWKRQLGRQVSDDASKDAEIRQLKCEQARATEERDILKKLRVFRSRCKVRYAFIAEHRDRFGVRAMCRCLAVQPRGFYAWRKSPLSQWAREDAWQTDLIRKAWHDSGKVYSYHKLHDDLLNHGETCCPNRVARLTRLAGIRAHRSATSVGPVATVASRPGGRQHAGSPVRRGCARPAWVTDITYIPTLEGFAYLAVVIDLYSRRVLDWSMQSRQTPDVVLQALHMAVWRRKPKHRVLIHSDQSSQFISMDWAAFIRTHNLEHSMSRRGDWHDMPSPRASSPR